LIETSLIIPTRNRPDQLGAAVESVLRGTRLPDELVIVDQSDLRPPPVRELETAGCEVRHVWSESRGSSLARNEAIELARYELLAFIDDDILVAGDWLETLVVSLVERGPRAAVTGKVLPREGAPGLVPSTIAEERGKSYRGRVAQDVLFSNNMGFWRAAVREIGGFDPRLGAGARYPSSEDNDFGFRLLEAGYEIAYIPQLTVYHDSGRSPSAFLRLQWDYGLGQGAFYAKHAGLRDRYMLGRLARDLSRRTRRGLERALHRHGFEAARQLVFALALLYGFARWMLSEAGRGEPGCRQPARRE
jgi:GT2 family glycosyltransferase